MAQDANGVFPERGFRRAQLFRTRFFYDRTQPDESFR